MQTRAEASGRSDAEQAEYEALSTPPVAEAVFNQSRHNADQLTAYLPDSEQFQPDDEYMHENGSWQPVPAAFFGQRIPQGVRVRREFLF